MQLIQDLLLFVLSIIDVANGLKHVNVLIFANDMNLFTKTDAVADQNRLQEDSDHTPRL